MFDIQAMPRKEHSQPYLTLGTHKAAHVLHNTYDGQLHFAAKVDLLPNILKWHFLQISANTGISTGMFHAESIYLPP